LEDDTVVWSTKLRFATLALASFALIVSAAPVAAATPTIASWTVHVERPFVDCSGFSTVGVWDISHRLTTFFNAAGVATRDIEQVDFVGEIVNGSTGASVPDSGSRTFFDTLAPDGSFLTTYMVEMRKSAYLHTAGRTDFQTGDSHGLNRFDDAGIGALCEALGG
jgi:hypothetical protein